MGQLVVSVTVDASPEEQAIDDSSDITSTSTKDFERLLELESCIKEV